MLLLTVLGLSLAANALLLYRFLVWKRNAYHAADIAQEKHLQMDLAFYMLAKKAGIAEDEKGALMAAIEQLAPMPVAIKVQMADALPFMATKNQAKQLGFH